MRHTWTEENRQTMREHYPHKPTRQVAEMIGCSVSACYQQADKMGLKKSRAYMTSPDSGRLQKGHRHSKETEFRRGRVPHNKGKKMPKATYAKVAPTMFKPGRDPKSAHNYRPIGSTRLNCDGVLERKVSDDPNVYPARRWVPVTRLVWEAAHGPVPAGHCVVFKPGQHTTEEHLITLDRLECISRTENMRRNTVHNLPQPLPQLVQLRGALNRKIRNRQRKINEKQAG